MKSVRRFAGQRQHRRGNIMVLAALLLVFMLGMVAFSVDTGYILTAKTELQTAADSGAMAAASQIGTNQSQVISAAKTFANYHKSGGKQLDLATSDVEFGVWDIPSKKFTASAGISNAVRVTARRPSLNLFFGKIFNKNTVDLTASAIAMAAPRDIVFVVDLSGSMNDDSEACWATNEITNTFTPLGYPTVGTDMIQTLYSDFNFGTYPGTVQWVGSPLGVTANKYAYAVLTKNSGVLTTGSIAATYKIISSDSEATRKTKAYKWIIDKQIAVIMPNAKPTPNSSTSYNYWAKYLDYIIEPVNIGSSGTGTPPANRGSIPPSQDSNRITGNNNPNTDGYTSASSAVPAAWRNKIGYQTYLQFMMDHGRESKPDGSTYTPLSRNSADCPYHNESTNGGTFSFPPREQPTHSARRAIIAAIKVIADRNANIPDASQKDWVSIVTYDTLSGGGPVVLRNLTSDYTAAMQSATTMQAVSDQASSTATESGLIKANQHLQPSASGGMGRQFTNKVVVLLTDGMPNLYSSTNGTISSYITTNPSSNFYSSGGNYAKNSALMQSGMMTTSKWQLFPVGLGLGTDYDFMDRMGRMGSTADSNGQSPRGSGNPAEYEQRMIDIFTNIVGSPHMQLVQ